MAEDNCFDVAVVGAGPAGALAAHYAARGGARVALFERKKHVGVPVRCGEGVGLKGFSQSIEVDPAWILSTMTKVRMISPGGIEVGIENIAPSYIVDRTKMDADLVEGARKAGARYFPSTHVRSVKREENGDYRCFFSGQSIKARCVILAEGVESKLARGLGWKTHLAPEDINVCAFCKVTHQSVANDTCVFYMGRKIAPGGYAWIFPRGDGVANVGLGILGSLSKPGLARNALEDFVNYVFPGSSVWDTHCGAVPVGKWLRPLVRDGVMIVGDAARQVHALTGGGIAYGLLAGKMAGTIAAEALRDDAVNYRHLRLYEKRWASGFGKQQLRSWALKSMALTFSDDYLDRIARILARRDPGKLGYLAVFARAFARNPLSMMKAIMLFR
ncbi:MAG: geranylgeranyl reductase family protein [Chitinivibrionales bacterium]|nr:geranylgeranyl reductase family protein [Chitinivibrionales bacterium]MBD3357583.1 geranylgeranyl reductase family protein [Chitinivibrionales bacterium]